MRLNVQDYPTQLRPIISRLQKAVKQKEVRDRMTAEDNLLLEFNTYQELIEVERTAKEEAIKRQEEAIKRQDEAIKRQEEAIKRQEEAIKRQEEAIVKLLADKAYSKKQLAEMFNVTLRYINKVEKKYF